MGKGKNRKSREDPSNLAAKGKTPSNSGSIDSNNNDNSGSDSNISSNNNNNNSNNTNNNTGGNTSGTGPVTTIADPSSVISVKKKDGSILRPNGAASAVRDIPASLLQWCLREQQGISWVLGCAFIGGLIGFGIGSGLLTGDRGPPNPWRVALGRRIRSTLPYRVVARKTSPWESFQEITTSVQDTLKEITLKDAIGFWTDWASQPKPSVVQGDPSHPRVFAVLREAILREKGGYVHPDLGFMVPAPSGASRGLGMVRDSYHKCQVNCMPGVLNEKLEAKNANATDPTGKVKIPKTQDPGKQLYKQEEVLVRIPLSYQMRRTVALNTILPKIPAEVQRKANLHELDDAVLLVLLLAHERGVGKVSRWLPYIASLPVEPSCGYSKKLRPHMLDSINAYHDELGLDVNGWPGELMKATKYAEKITNALVKDYGSFISHPKDISAYENIEWALCQVASRATGGSQKFGQLRMIPILDMINHDANAGGFVEITGTERLDNGGFLDAREEDRGSFVVRSLRHGRRKALRKGQELLVNYNVPHYSPLDWLVSLGFVPPERWGQWEKVDSALPRIRRDGPASDDLTPSAQLWHSQGSDI